MLDPIRSTSLREAQRQYGPSHPALRDPLILDALEVMHRRALNLHPEAPWTAQNFLSIACYLSPSRGKPISLAFLKQSALALREAQRRYRQTHPELQDPRIMHIFGAVMFHACPTPENYLAILETFRSVTKNGFLNSSY